MTPDVEKWIEEKVHYVFSMNGGRHMKDSFKMILGEAYALGHKDGSDCHVSVEAIRQSERRKLLEELDGFKRNCETCKRYKTGDGICCACYELFLAIFNKLKSETRVIKAEG